MSLLAEPFRYSGNLQPPLSPELPGPVEFTPEEMDIMEQQFIAQNPPMEEYTSEELDAMERQIMAQNPPVEEYTAQDLDKMEVGQLHDPSYYPSMEEWRRLRGMESELKESGALPSGFGLVADAIGGLFVMAKDAISDAVTDPVDSWKRSPATIQVGGSRMLVNMAELAVWAKTAMKGNPDYRDEETGEFIFESRAPQRMDRDISDLDRYLQSNPTAQVRPVTGEDLEQWEYQRFLDGKTLRGVYEELGDQQAPPEYLYNLVTTGGASNEMLAANPNQAAVVEVVTDPINLVSFAGVASKLGLSSVMKGVSARMADGVRKIAGGSADKIDEAAGLFTAAVEKRTGMTAETQRSAAKWMAAGGGAAFVGANAELLPEELKKPAAAIPAFYLLYRAGLGTLRKIETGARTSAVILREAADATKGLDQVARAAVVANPDVPDVFRAAVANPRQFLSVESTPARLAVNEALSPQTRAIMDRLANPLIVQSVRGVSAAATGTAKGAMFSAPFAAIAAGAGEGDQAATMLGMGAAFGGLGGVASRGMGLRQRRQQAAVSDVARMFVDVELAGGDVSRMAKTMNTDELVRMAAMQGFFRQKVDVIPIGAEDYSLNVNALGGAGSAGMYVHAPKGERARVFLNVDAKRGNVLPHELGHALLASGALDGNQAASARMMVEKRYTTQGVEARAKEYATNLLSAEAQLKFPGQKLIPSEREIKAKLDELSERGLKRGDADPLDWARDEIFAEEFSRGSQGMRFDDIRRGYGGAVAGFTEFAEGVLGAQARALSASGIPIDPRTGAVRGNVDRLFQMNPLLDEDAALKKSLRQYMSNYQQWIRNPDVINRPEAGVKIAPGGSAAELMNNPQVRFYDRGDGILQNEFARIDPRTGQAVLRSEKEIAAETRARQTQMKSIISGQFRKPNDPVLGRRRRSDGAEVITGKVLPKNFDFLNGYAPHVREFARGFERMAETGESMQVRYHSIGSGDSGAFRIKRLGNLEAINREVIPFGWQMTKPGNLLAQVLDLTQVRNRALRAINLQKDEMSPFNYDMAELEAGLKTWMNNHRQGLPGENGIGIEKRDAINALMGINTKLNRSRNPMATAFGSGSAIKSFRLDRVDAMAPTGRTGFFFDYNKANGNFMPEIETPLPDMSQPVGGITVQR